MGREVTFQSTRPAQIAVDAGRILWRIPATLRGFNFWGTRADDAFMPEYRAIGVKLLRFPPGRTGDENDLQRSLIDDSAKVARALNGDLTVLVRLRGGTPERAAENVRYTNIDKGYGARFWEVGNEPDIYGRRAGEPEFSPEWYAERFRVYAQAMKAVDPSIKIFGPVLSHKLDEWMPPFIRACGDIIDGLCWHFYGGNAALAEADLLASTTRFDDQAARVRGWWRDRSLNPQGANRDVALMISEYGASYETNNPRNLITHAAALWTADMLGHLALNQIDIAAYFTLWGINYHGVWDRRGAPQPVHAIFQLFSGFGERLVRAESDQPLLAAFAALREDGVLTLLLVNKNPAEGYDMTLEPAGFAPLAGGRMRFYSADAPLTAVSLATETAPLRFTIPPYTAALLEIPGQETPPVAPVALIGGALGLAAAAAGALAFIRRRGRKAKPRAR